MPGDDPRSKPHRKPRLSKTAIDAMKRHVGNGVGYGNPPEHTRFQKGQSGNPKGRPRSKAPKAMPLAELPIQRAILEETSRPVRIREGDKVSDLPAGAALVRALLSSALKGNARSIGLAFDFIKEAQIAQALEIRRRMDWATEYKKLAHDAVQTAIAAGKSPPALLPHPDDLVIDDERGFRVVGPIDEAEQKQLDETLRYRDTLIMQDVLDRRLKLQSDGPRDAQPGGDQAGGALLFAMMLDRVVPERFRLSDIEMLDRQMSLDRQSKRELLKILYRAWKSFGVHVPRGGVFPGIDIAKRRIEFTFAFKAAVDEGEIDLDAACRGEFDAEARRFFENWGYRFDTQTT